MDKVTDSNIDKSLDEIISCNKVEVIKYVNKCFACVDEIVTYKVIIENRGNIPLTSVFFKDVVPYGLCFIKGTVCICGRGFQDLSPNRGFPVSDIKPCSSVTISFKVKVKCVPHNNPVNNTALLRYYIGEEGYTKISNSVPLYIRNIDGADLTICKSGFIAMNKCLNVVYFTIKIGNYGPCEAKDVTLCDCLPSIVKNPRFSLDDGVNWNKWGGKCRLGTLPPCKHFNILISGVVGSKCCKEIVNTAEVKSCTYDPNPNNNKVTITAYPKCKNK